MQIKSALAHPEFESLVNPITTRGADYAHHIPASPAGFENPLASLLQATKYKTWDPKISHYVVCGPSTMDYLETSAAGFRQVPENLAVGFWNSKNPTYTFFTLKT